MPLFRQGVVSSALVPASDWLSQIAFDLICTGLGSAQSRLCPDQSRTAAQSGLEGVQVSLC